MATSRPAAAYLEGGGSVEGTARALFLHANTVRYRLKKLTDVVGYDLTAPREALVWRSQFLLGALYYSLINPERVTRLSRGTADGNDHEAAIAQLVAATHASLRSLSTEPQDATP